jgi:hypothetical protein
MLLYDYNSHARFLDGFMQLILFDLLLFLILGGSESSGGNAHLMYKQCAWEGCCSVTIG